MDYPDDQKNRQAHESQVGHFPAFVESAYVHIYPSTFEFESRILKITRSLCLLPGVRRIMILAKGKAGLPQQEALDAKREVRRISARLRGDGLILKSFGFLEWSARVVWMLRRETVVVVNCHSLSVLPLCVALSLLHRACLVYEPHELETETSTMKGIRQPVARWLERCLIRRAEVVITVSDSIAREYESRYGLRDVHVIKNVPPLRTDSAIRRSAVFRERFRLSTEAIIFLYQGALEEERGVSILLETFKDISPECHIVFMGFGSLAPQIQEWAARCPQIHYHEAVPPENVQDYTCGGDVGIAFLDDCCLNHLYALPNKLFEYLHAGMPVIVSNLPEMTSLVQNHDCGWPAYPTVDDMRRVVSERTWEEIRRAAENTARCRTKFNWQKEEEKLLRIYRENSALAVGLPS
jgi:glycosyltransferase involved in cell wall biosynthesis